MHRDNRCRAGASWQRHFVDDAVCRLYLLCQRARAGDADATALLAPYLAPFSIQQPLSGPWGNTVLPHPARLARHYRHCWTVPIDVYTDAATERPHGASVPATADDNIDDDADAGGHKHADDLDDHGWTYHVMVGHGAAENDVVLFGLDRGGSVRYETGYYVIPHGQDPDPIGGRSAGQRLGYAGRRRAPRAIRVYPSALPPLLQAVAAASCVEAQATLRDQTRPEPLLSFSRSDGDHDMDEAHATQRRQPADDAPSGGGANVYYDHNDLGIQWGGRRVGAMMGAASLRSGIAPLRRVADLPPAIVAYINDNEPDAGRLWLGGRPVSVTSLGRRSMALALRLYAGHAAGQRASCLFDRPLALTGMAARVCAAAAVPLDQQRAPAETLALVGAHIWHLVCADDPLPSGRLPRATRLLDAARALGVTPTTAELRLPELLCATLAAPALLCAEIWAPSLATAERTCPLTM